MTGKTRPRVVVADDHPSVLVAFERMLQSSCDVVALVANGHAAVEAVLELLPDVLVADLMMPDMDGLEVCRKVREVAPQTLIIIVTSFDDACIEEISCQVGASAFVRKHSAAGTLEGTIQRLVAAKQGISREAS